MISVLGVGDNTIDVYLDKALGYPGGNAVNVSVFCRRLGANAAYVGAVGDDTYGERLLAGLKRETVDVSHCQAIPGANAWACVEHRDGDRRFLGSDPGVCKKLELTRAIRQFMTTFDVVHTSAYSGLDHQLPSLRKSCTRLSYDLSDDWTDETLRAVCPWVDVAFISTQSSEAECHQLAHACLKLGTGQVVITRGEQGAFAYTKDSFAQQPAISTNVVDTMAAGDGFIAAYLMAWLSGQPQDQCLHSGASYAARVCREKGGFGHSFALESAFRDSLIERFRPGKPT